MEYFYLDSQPIDRQQLVEKFQNPSCGAFVSFEGWVRDHHQNQKVSHLFYEAYPELALREGQVVMQEAIQTFDIQSAICVHRSGHLNIGDMAVWVGINSAHRDAAFQACRFVIDEIKTRVPIWKKEYYVGSKAAQWLGSETAPHDSQD